MVFFWGISARRNDSRPSVLPQAVFRSAKSCIRTYILKSILVVIHSFFCILLPLCPFWVLVLQNERLQIFTTILPVYCVVVEYLIYSFSLIFMWPITLPIWKGSICNNCQSFRKHFLQRNINVVSQTDWKSRGLVDRVTKWKTRKKADGQNAFVRKFLTVGTFVYFVRLHLVRYLVLELILNSEPFNNDLFKKMVQCIIQWGCYGFQIGGAKHTLS